MKKPILLLFLSFVIVHSTRAQTALSFISENPDYVEIGTGINDRLAGTNTITVEAWVYLTDYPFLPTIVGNYGGGQMQFLLRVDWGQPAFWVDNGSGYQNIYGASTVPLFTWTHIAGVWNGSDLRIYVNGVEDGVTTDIYGAFYTHYEPVRIGANLFSEAFAGKIDDVRIWSYARSQGQIAASMNQCLTGLEPGMLAFYDCEDGGGPILIDKTGHGYDGLLMNFTTWDTGLGCLTLPVNFVSVSAAAQNNGISVNWKVAAEHDVLRYEVEHSFDGRSFSKAGAVAATNHIDYEWFDAGLTADRIFYRIKSVDRTGTFKYSSVVRVNTASAASKLSVWPNPVVNNTVNVQFNNQAKGLYDIQIRDLSGRSILRTTAENTGGYQTTSIQLPATVSAGIYVLVAVAPDRTVQTTKLFIRKGE